MTLRRAIAIFPMLLWFMAAPSVAVAEEDDDTGADTTIVVDRVQVTAIKQGRVLRAEPVASTIVGSREISRSGITAVKELAERVPNLHIPDYGSRMTSTVYVRGLGARIDQPVIGINVDNVPVLNKNLFDTELADIERIEVLRGPQSTLYGRNTMGGVMNIYTLSPLRYEGVRLSAGYGSGNTWRVKASAYQKINPDFGFSVVGHYTTSDGLFENLATGRNCDREESGGGRWRLHWRNSRGLEVDNTFAFSLLEQGGYPYAYAGEDKVDAEGNTIIRRGEIRYNDPAGYTRTAFNDGVTVRYDAGRFTVASITGYHFSDDCMTLDQDFLPLSYFTLEQATREHALTEDLIFRSLGEGRYRWVTGVFGFFRHTSMSAPVEFRRQGIEELIFANANKQMAAMGIHYTPQVERLPLDSDFRNTAFGAALYHESNYTVGRWRFTAGLRLDYEHTALKYHSAAQMPYTLTIDGTDTDRTVSIDERNRIAHDYFEWLPKVAVTYSFDQQRNIYFSVAKGYKAGGFNTQMFSDILQEKVKWQMVGSTYRESDVMSYRPEKSWNFELGGHFSCLEGAIRGDVALFWIECRDQQLTRFPEGQTTGRMMTNAGKTRSRGGEFSLQLHPWKSLELTASYGMTDARFLEYDDGTADYAGKQLPYAPRHTLAARAAWSIPTGVEWLGEVVLSCGIRSAGGIRWNEANTLRQDLYTLLDASVRIEHPHYSVDFWGRNITDTRYDTFYFKSMGNEFTQRGRGATFGMTISLNILEPR